MSVNSPLKSSTYSQANRPNVRRGAEGRSFSRLGRRARLDADPAALTKGPPLAGVEHERKRAARLRRCKAFVTAAPQRDRQHARARAGRRFGDSAGGPRDM